MKHLTTLAVATALIASAGQFSHAQNTVNPDAKYLTYPSYDGQDLELVVDNAGTHWRLWSPEAQAARVILYDTGANTPAVKTIDMTKAQSGTWTASVPQQLYGKFYTFSIKYNGKWLDETPGVWAKALGVNGQRAAIIDFAATNPAGWETDKGPELKSYTDAMIYEMHHRDYSIHPQSGIANKGKFLALTEPDTHNSTGQSTGIDHLKDLGVTHVHILPSFDYNSVDEANLPANTYNWGYDPINYNAPEGSYSTNPSDPATRVREMKEMVKSLHDNGLGVIMDVVYNHTAIGDGSNFSLTAPGYYYRHRQDGSYSDASGCGNETASERQQMRDFIVNSVKYWAKEYHIDGFRFDLMAIHDIETMNQVAEELHKINPNIIIYGEGWTAGDSPLPVEERALKDHAYQMPGVAVFSDDIRDAVKGHYSDAKDRGFATGKPGNEETVKIGIVGATAHPQVDYSKGNNSKKAYANRPGQVINYVSCHDDLSLTDKLGASMTGSSEEQRQRAARLAQTIIFTSQGVPFMFTGEEVFRNKKGHHNTYNMPDSVNAIDWGLLDKNADQYEYYRQLTRLRKAHPAFRMNDAAEVARNLVFDTKEKRDNVISYSLKNHANGDSAEEIKVIFNGQVNPVEVKVPKGNWRVLGYDGRLNADGLTNADGTPMTLKGGKFTVPATSALILVR